MVLKMKNKKKNEHNQQQGAGFVLWTTGVIIVRGQLFFAGCAIGQYVGNTIVKLLFARNAPINFCK